MKKVTSAALLAIKLTWSVVLLTFILTLGVQIIDGFRELMPGGVPLQATFAFENLLRSAAQKVGQWWMVYLLGALIGTTGPSKGSKSIYTLNRLGLSENQMTLVFGAVFTGYFLLYWALQIAVCYGFFVWYSRFTLVGSNAWMLACWRSEWLHTLLPLGEWWGYLRNTVICLSFGFTAAFNMQRARREKHATVSLFKIVPPVLCLFLLNGRVGSLGPNLCLTVLLTAFVIGDWFALKGGREDEDL